MDNHNRKIILWIIIASVLFVSSKESVLRVHSYKSDPRTMTYADCIKYELLLAETHNISDTRAMCNNLFTTEMKRYSEHMKDTNVANYVRHLLRGVHSEMDNHGNRNKRSIFTGGIHIRREIREPPYDKNWGCYLRGVRRLKNNYDVKPDMSTYDVIANLHTPDSVIVTSHDGPGFFAWHREYLRIMELAIGCPIPYWDTTPDQAMENPQESNVWTDKYFGNAFGIVTTGIMKGLKSFLPILRNINSGGWLISKKDIEMAMGKPSLYEFTEASPCGEDDRTKYSWECFHKGIHDWIDGTIGPSNTTTFDPIFYPIHAFVDKIFELYRQKIKSKGISPELTYPVKNITLHEPSHKTVWVPIYPDLESLTNSECYGDKLAALTKYSLGPRCPDCYGGVDMYCNQTLNICVSKPRTEEEKYIIKTIAIKTPTGVKLFDTVSIDEPERSKELIEKIGPLPYGKKFNVNFPDPRTRGDPFPDLNIKK